MASCSGRVRTASRGSGSFHDGKNRVLEFDATKSMDQLMQSEVRMGYLEASRGGLQLQPSVQTAHSRSRSPHRFPLQAALFGCLSLLTSGCWVGVDRLGADPRFKTTLSPMRVCGRSDETGKSMRAYEKPNGPSLVQAGLPRMRCDWVVVNIVPCIAKPDNQHPPEDRGSVRSQDAVKLAAECISDLQENPRYVHHGQAPITTSVASIVDCEWDRETPRVSSVPKDLESDGGIYSSCTIHTSPTSPVRLSATIRVEVDWETSDIDCISMQKPWGPEMSPRGTFLGEWAGRHYSYLPWCSSTADERQASYHKVNVDGNSFECFTGKGEQRRICETKAFGPPLFCRNEEIWARDSHWAKSGPMVNRDIVFEVSEIMSREDAAALLAGRDAFFRRAVPVKIERHLKPRWSAEHALGTYLLACPARVSTVGDYADMLDPSRSGYIGPSRH